MDFTDIEKRVGEPESVRKLGQRWLGSGESLTYCRRSGGAMGVADDTYLRLSAQRALLTRVTLRLRAMSVDVDPESCRVWTRFIFDGGPIQRAI